MSKFNIFSKIYVQFDKAGVMKTVPSVYNPLIGSIYLYHSTQEKLGNHFGKHMVTEKYVEAF